MCVYCVSYVLFNNNFFFLLSLSLAYSFCFLCECIHRPAGAISFFYHSQQDSYTHTHQSSRLMKKKSDDCYRVFCSFSSFSIDLNECTNRMLPIFCAIKFTLYINTLLSINRNNFIELFLFFLLSIGYIEMNNIDTFCFLQ